MNIYKIQWQGTKVITFYVIAGNYNQAVIAALKCMNSNKEELILSIELFQEEVYSHQGIVI